MGSVLSHWEGLPQLVHAARPVEENAVKTVFVFITSIAVLFALGGCGQDSPKPAEHSQPIEQPEPYDGKSLTTNTNAQTQGTDKSDGDPNSMTLYRQARALMKAGKHEEGYATAKKAMAQFIAEDNDLAWILIDSITLKDRRIDVHFNMGPSEREPPDIGLVKPLSFRVWSIGEDVGILEIIDFEIGRIGGESVTAAIGKTEGEVHANLGTLSLDASYEVITNAVLDVISRNKDESK